MQLQEAPLCPLVILRITSVNLAVPVDRIAELLGLFAEIGDIGLRRFLWRDTGLNRIVLGRKAESIIAEWAQNVQFSLSIEARQDIDNGKITDMTNVQPSARGVREHLGEVFFRLRIATSGLSINRPSFESLRLGPDFLPFLFDFQRVISIHGDNYTID